MRSPVTADGDERSRAGGTRRRGCPWPSTRPACTHWSLRSGGRWLQTGTPRGYRVSRASARILRRHANPRSSSPVVYASEAVGVLDSVATRLSWARGPWSAQRSAAVITEPELVTPYDAKKLTGQSGWNGSGPGHVVRDCVIVDERDRVPTATVIDAGLTPFEVIVTRGGTGAGAGGGPPGAGAGPRAGVGDGEVAVRPESEPHATANITSAPTSVESPFRTWSVDPRDGPDATISRSEFERVLSEPGFGCGTMPLRSTWQARSSRCHRGRRSDGTVSHTRWDHRDAIARATYAVPLGPRVNVTSDDVAGVTRRVHGDGFPAPARTLLAGS